MTMVLKKRPLSLQNWGIGCCKMGKAFMEASLEEGEGRKEGNQMHKPEKMGSWRLSVDNYGSSEGMSGSISQSMRDLPCDEFHIEEDDMFDGASTSSDASSPLGWPLGRSLHAGSLLYTPPGLRTVPPATARRDPYNTPPRRPLFPASSFQSLSSPLSHHHHLPPNGSSVSQHLHLPDQRKELPKPKAQMSEVELMRERFAKLLLGEDMSGGAKGVSSALAISNAITNLSASVFGEIWRLEPLSMERKLMWRREMDWLLSVADYVVELVPSWQTFPDGHDLEVMVSRPRSDLHINLPALRKLDAMLLESLDTFNVALEFWYVEQDSAMSDHEDSQLTMPLLQRQEEKWWLPSPKVPTNGLSDKTVKHLKNQRECISQILKAALAINNQILAEMEVPDMYWESLPKTGKASVGEQVYKQITSPYFSPEATLCTLDLSTGHATSELANRLEAAIHVWRRKRQRKVRARRLLLTRHARGHASNQGSPNQRNAGQVGLKFDTKASWSLVRDLVLDMDRRELLASRGESLLLCLHQKFPNLPQSLLDRLKIQYNKDVGQSILESYSRVLESLASNIIARIDDVLRIDQITKRTASK